MCIHWADAVRTAVAAATASFVALSLAHAQGYPNTFQFGQPASEQEIAAIAIAIPADGKGLPLGQGDYAGGKQVYESACAACHGADLMGVANMPNMPAGASLRLIGGRVARCRSPRPARCRPTKSMRCVRTSSLKQRLSTKARCSTRKPCRASKCPTATGLFRTHVRKLLNRCAR